MTELFHVAYWFASVYSKRNAGYGATFDVKKLPPAPADAAKQSSIPGDFEEKLGDFRFSCGIDLSAD